MADPPPPRRAASRPRRLPLVQPDRNGELAEYRAYLVEMANRMLQNRPADAN
jgi:hypothetical protein